MARISHNKLRRLATRAVRVLERHRDGATFLLPYDQTLVPIVERFTALHDELPVVNTRREKQRQDGSHSITALQLCMRGWLGALKRDMVGFDAGPFRARADVPDDVIVKAERLMELVRKYGEAGESPLPYSAELLADLGNATEAASRELAAMQDALTQLQSLQAALRDVRAELERELVAFRSALRTVLGSRHRDYQKLRVPRGYEASVGDQAALEDADDPIDETAAGQLASPAVNATPTEPPAKPPVKPPVKPLPVHGVTMPPVGTSGGRPASNAPANGGAAR